MVSGSKVIGVRQEEGTRDILHEAPVGAWRRKGRKGAISRIRIKMIIVLTPKPKTDNLANLSDTVVRSEQ